VCLRVHAYPDLLRYFPAVLSDELIALIPVLRRLPRRLDRVTSALEHGRLALNVWLFADERDRRVVTGLTHQFLLSFLGVASSIVAALLLGIPGGPRSRQGSGCAS
jgi:ubiquinone biosynthesis protein